VNTTTATPPPPEEPMRLGLALSTVNLSIDTLEELYLKLRRVGIKGQPLWVRDTLLSPLGDALYALREARRLHNIQEPTE
jgi:hypothetical protein